MSKPKHERMLAETEAQAVTRNIRVSPRKLNLVAGLIRGRTAQDAVGPWRVAEPRPGKVLAQALPVGAVAGVRSPAERGAQPVQHPQRQAAEQSDQE